MKKGMVTLVGAGPGDSGLMTLKGAQKLSKADTVVFDRLVSAEILAMIPAGVEKIDVGKSGGNHPVPQDKINEILLQKALEGKNVVRLKGGDPFVFGRGGEELELLEQSGVDFEVVPGVTSAVAVPAYAGIPLTHRDYCSSFHVITGHAREGGSLQIPFESLVKFGGTLVFLMGVSSLAFISKGLIEAGMDRELLSVEPHRCSVNLFQRCQNCLPWSIKMKSDHLL
jgi:uroporphyrinogen III methyltransferase/synthase